MSYESALAAAGATVIAFESFGSYQGDWWALVELKGERLWINGSFGSCSYCDSFEGEFGDWYGKDDDPEYLTRLADFGKTYLDGGFSQDEAEKRLEKEVADWDWDDEAKRALEFVRSHAPAKVEGCEHG